jgi:Ca-activated chloride channel family protein
MRSLIIFLIPFLAAQTMRVEVALVTVGVRVIDSNGDAITGLRSADFTLLEEGSQRSIAFFSNQERPISLSILLDRSNSMDMSGKLRRAREAASSLVQSSHPDTKMLYLPFDVDIPRDRDFTADREHVESLIETTEPGEGTALYDAIVETLRRSIDAPLPMQALVLITDGTDQHSRHSLDDVIRAVEVSQVQLYMIGYFSRFEDQLFRSSAETIRRIDGREVDNPRMVFQRLARESGAEAYFPKSGQDLRRAIEEISRDLRQQYTLAFYPPRNAPAGSYRRLQVKVNRPGATVRARPGYRVAHGVRY